MAVEFNAALFFAALGLSFIIEALPWILSPVAFRASLLMLVELPDEILRGYGIMLLGLGLLIVWLAIG